MNVTRDYRKLHGLCIGCGGPKDDPAKGRCAGCRADDAAKARARAQKKRDAWSAAGLCSSCGAEREDESYAKCVACRESRKQQAQGYRESGKLSTRDRRKAASLCVDCAIDISNQESGIRCPGCQDKNAVYRRELTKRKATEGTCCYCPQPALPGKTLCATCAEKNSGRNTTAKEKRVAAGICRHCASPATHSSECCPYHFVYNLLKNWGRAPTSDEVDAVWTKLEDQEFKCFYTGIPIIPGGNASIEHVFPRKRYPDEVWTLDNITWCDSDVNRLKGPMTPEEVITFAEGLLRNKEKILAVRLPNRE